MDNVELEIKNDALIEISKLAIKRKTGARGLRSIMEDLLVDLMYDAPDQKDLKKIALRQIQTYDFQSDLIALIPFRGILEGIIYQDLNEDHIPKVAA